ncbi:MAG: succinylglutamate desuccinylase/aspartoacylase family protein [Candidatus Nealsonbacteria bacterium]|nr:succinylglutamate desuccinylase/aspartoacylase family protein [Candidatus Nealsonbacteria bacterium]
MIAKDFYSKLLSSLKNRKDIVIKKYKLHYKKGKYDFLRIASEEIMPMDKIIMIRAGIHGDEIAGPITILDHANEIIDLIHDNGLKIILYPLGNPSGFEIRTRYNADYKDGDSCNNDFLRYELEHGLLVETIGDNVRFEKWHWLSDVAEELRIKLPAETKLMHRLLKKDPLSQISGFVDLHQDFKTPGLGMAAAYHYSFDGLEAYENIVKCIEEIAPLLSDEIGADERGFIIEHDGSLDDLMHRLGVKYCVTCETTGATPLDIACQVNLIWIKGIADLVKEVK